MMNQYEIMAEILRGGGNAQIRNRKIKAKF